MIGSFIYFILLVINCLVLRTADVEGWQYWVSLLCLIGSYIAGSESSRYK